MKAVKAQICMRLQTCIRSLSYRTLSLPSLAITSLGSITSRCSGKWARTHPPKDRTRETAEIEPSFLGAISPRITLTKEKERRKKNARRKKGGEEKNSNCCTLGFCNGYFRDLAEKIKVLDEKDHLPVAFSKIRLEMFKWNIVIAKRIFFYE